MEGHESKMNGVAQRPGLRGSDWGSIALLDKTVEFFQTCDVEGKGFITRTNMRRLDRELPLSAEELEDVFDSLDTDSSGCLTLDTFSSGFSQFLHGRRISVSEEHPMPVFRTKEALYQSQWEAKLQGGEDEEERHFSMLLDSLGARNVFEDPGEVRSLWAQLRRDEPHLLSNFEEFLARVTHQIKEAHQEKKEMESALQRKAATHDSEIRYLYEEMEAQIKNEKDRLLLKDSERLQMKSLDLEHQLTSKEKELEQLFHKQKRLEVQCRELSSEKQESHVENVKLKMTNDELTRALDTTSQELVLAQEQLTLLQDQAARLQQEKEMEMYRVTEGLQREKQSLMKQLDLLREMNKHLKDERDICCGVPRTSLRKKQKQRGGLAELFDGPDPPTHRPPLLEEGSFQSLEALPIEHLQIVFVASSSCSEDDPPPPTASAAPPACQQQPSVKKSTAGINGAPGPAPAKPKVKKSLVRTGSMKRAERERVKKELLKKPPLEEEALDAPPDGWPLRRVISIEEDHLPHLLQGGPQLLLHQLSEEEHEEEEEEEDEAQSDVDPNVAVAVDLTPEPPSSRIPVPAEGPTTRKSRFVRSKKKTPMSPRVQPVGKETQPTREAPVFAPDRLFKVVLVGNSSVGKTSLLRSFCEGHFQPSTVATVGIDYSVKTLTLDNMQVAMQLWDTAGQERFRSITKQFFRKADGVVLMYDVTVLESFRAVKPWLENIKDAAEEGIPVLMLGNKMDMDGERAVTFREAEQLALENKVMFYEVSAFTGKFVTESLTHLARVLMEQEDRVRDTTIVLSAQPLRRKACCK
ncbi:EF-hand calcium-binding domain-containing protein 4B isoform X1 [Synchiropus splendidus]|uniref:EF-hand calcium-binding domain-containing protein 4B isoform X1 n=1 Tax=Synchiropus splendidus TaxID=270530 RepID=UPI00237DAA55|nr:EF-hand calcium-binding domain-containing protein 4B isoform X1 [Synchiropus splendidus]